MLTGESEPVRATTESTHDNFLETKNIGLQGTLCVSGSGTGVVILSGDQTVFGRIAKLASSGAPGLTPLQKEILRFVLIIVSLAITVSVIVIILWAAWLRPDHPGFISNSLLIIDIVSVSVAFIPEGLPACVTISLAVIARTLSKAKVLCKSLTTVETLGSVNVLCSDKTGTLTKNQMTVTSVTILDKVYSPQQARDMLVGDSEAKQNIKEMAAVAAICNGASFADTLSEDPVELKLINGDATGEFMSHGKADSSPSDSAILRFAEHLRSVRVSRSEWEQVYGIDFSSRTKMMIKVGTDDDLRADNLSSSK